MLEPANKSFVRIGDLGSSDPWDVQVWARDDETATHKGRVGDLHWFLSGVEQTEPQSWPALMSAARNSRSQIAVFGEPTDIETP